MELYQKLQELRKSRGLTQEELAEALSGILKVLFVQFKSINKQKIVTDISIIIRIVTVIYLALAGETYAVTIAFLLLIFKGMLLFKYKKAE